MLDKNYSWYDYEKGQCHYCGTLLEETDECFQAHEEEAMHKFRVATDTTKDDELKAEITQWEKRKKEDVMEKEKAVAVLDAPRDVAPTLVGTLQETEKRYQELQAFIQKQMVESEDYGKIPGCPKPSLFKAGAEKLLEIYGYAVSDIETVNKVENWEKGFFHYEIKATAISKRSGQVVGVGIGSCNSKEKKYISQDPYSLVNTLQKMAKKRAVVDLALLVTRSSGIFTQDIEDLEANGHTQHQAVNPIKQEQPQHSQQPQQPQGALKLISEKQMLYIKSIAKTLAMSDEDLANMLETEFGTPILKELTSKDASNLIERLRQ